jgi:ABC-type dipeptide/oligopeptide/nickel transport system permease component
VVVLRFEVRRALFDNRANVVAAQEGAPMNLLITFLVAVIIGIVGVAWVGVIVDKMTSSFTSLLIFFPLFFLTIYVTWKLSVKLTEPKATP